MGRVCHVSLRAGMCLPGKHRDWTHSMPPTRKKVSVHERPESDALHNTRQRRERTCHTRSTRHDTRRVASHVCTAALSQKRLPPSSPTAFPLVTVSVQGMCSPGKHRDWTHSMPPTRKRYVHERPESDALHSPQAAHNTRQHTHSLIHTCCLMLCSGTRNTSNT